MDLENTSRKRPRSLSLLSMYSQDMEEYWETKTLQRNEFSSKRIKLDQCED